MTTQTIAGIIVPFTPTVAAAQTFAKHHLESWAYNHVMRSWLLSICVADRMPGLSTRDHEVQAVAALLHDLGWSKDPALISNDKIFEVDGANAARGFIEGQANAAEWDVHRKQLLWDAIALHTYPPVALHKEVEVRVVGMGIFADFTGPAGVLGGLLTEEQWKAICAAFPRDGFRSNVTSTLCGICRSKPETTYLNFIADFGEELVEGYSRKGKRAFDAITHAVDSD